MKLDLLQELQAAKLIEHFSSDKKEPESLIPRIRAINHLINKVDTNYTLNDPNEVYLILNIASSFIRINNDEIFNLGELSQPFLKNYKKFTDNLKG